MSSGPSPSDRLSARRIPALDGLRGLAILLVFLYHLALFGGWTPTVGLDRGLRELMLHGWMGVDLFFVLSGFLITGILLDTRGDPGWLRRFYLRRIFRIVPAYYAALLVQLLVLALAGDPGRARLGWSATWLTNHLVAREGWDALATTLHHFWSLAVEEQYYLVWPVLVALVPLGRMRGMALLLVVTACVTRVVFAQRGDAVASYVLLPARMDGLAVGALLAMMLREASARRLGDPGPRESASARPGPEAAPSDGVAEVPASASAAATLRALRIPFVASVVLLALLGWWRGRLAYGDPFMLAFGLGALALVAGVVMVYAMGRELAGRGPRWLASGPLPLLGRYSYALYLWHQPIILWLTGAGLTATSLPALFDSRLPGVLLLGLVAGMLSLAAALASWHLVEQPAARLKERLTAPPAP